MSDRRRAEIELKRAKLAELRKAREERKKQDETRKSNSSTPGLGSRTDDRREEERAKVHHLVTNLLGDHMSRRIESSTPGSSVPSTPAAGYSSLAPGGHGFGNVTRSASRLSDSGSEMNTRNNTMVQAGDAPDRYGAMYTTRKAMFTVSKVLCLQHSCRILSTLSRSFLRCLKR